MCKHTDDIYSICKYPSYPECGIRGVLVSYEHRGHWFFFRASALTIYFHRVIFKCTWNTLSSFSIKNEDGGGGLGGWFLAPSSCEFLLRNT